MTFWELVIAIVIALRVNVMLETLQVLLTKWALGASVSPTVLQAHILPDPDKA